MTAVEPARDVDSAAIARIPARPMRNAAGIATSIVAAALFDAVLLFALATGRIGWLPFIVGHITLSVGLGACTLRLGRADGDCTLPLLATASIAAAGPIGALSAIATVALARFRSEDHQLLDDWYHRIAMAVETDEVTDLCEQVMSGRTSDLTGRPPRSFASVMDRGSLDERQAALGIIARNFHPDYLPVLMMALKSPEPVIRVQAAAVATRVRANLRALVDRHALDAGSAIPGSLAASRAAEHLDSAIASGLLDEGDRIRAGVLADRLRAASTASAKPASLVPLSPLDRATTETILLREGRFAEFRVGRRIAGISAAGAYRVRRPGRTHAAEAS